jgi:GT2 family glycosyltransferase
MVSSTEASGRLAERGAGDCLVSIVIVSWNTRELLRACLTSTIAAGRELDAPVEVIVVDNASGDGSAEMVRQEFPAVRLIANTANAGFAAANNQGLSQSRGRYLLLLNPDTKADSQFLRLLVGFLEKHPRAGAVGPRLIGKDGEDQVSCFPLPTIPREAWRLFHLDWLHPRASYPAARLRSPQPQRVESIQGACLLVRRSAVEETGLLDERFFIYTEEIDLCRRLLDCGWQIFWIPQAVVVHYGGASTAQVSGRMFLELYRSKVQYFRKHTGAFGVAGYKAVLLAATLARLVLPPLAMAVMPSRREQWRSVLTNYSSLLVELRAL